MQKARGGLAGVTSRARFFGAAHSTAWLIPQFRHNLDGEREHEYAAREGQQQIFRATFPGIRNSIRVLIGKRANALARKLHETHDMAVKDELERLLKEYGELG